MGTLNREPRMDAPSLKDERRAARRNRFARLALALLGGVLAVGAWQGYGVLLYGIEGSYDH
jgi:ferric-dicitrate binding protein FerR (iron transport regulator)